MTWQRIDENTYIDDTLVTCAEYQLFIDEMREQEKYYQPDHWTSYQFPVGMAREPILGVRHSDALEFCKWLAERSEGTWIYRLPNPDEANIIPLRLVDRNSFGFWSTNISTKPFFSWSAPIPGNKRSIDLDVIQNKFIDRAIIEAENFLEYQSLDFNAGSPPLILEIIIYFSKVIRSIFNTFSRISRSLQNTFINRNRKLIVTRADTLMVSMNNAYTRLCSDGIDCQIDRAIKNNLDQEINYAIVDLLRRGLDQTKLEMTCNIIINLYTLRERIAGRSPAFEGIRLVKERIR